MDFKFWNSYLQSFVRSFVNSAFFSIYIESHKSFAYYLSENIIM